MGDFRPKAPVEVDRRERARIVVDKGAAVLLSAPIFNVGQGNPYEQIEILSSLGPDVLPYKGKFQRSEFLNRLLMPEHRELSIGAALLNQQIVAGLGNYLRAEVLFSCRLNPWTNVADLNKRSLSCLSKTIPELSRRSYLLGGLTASDEQRERMSADSSLVYQPGREYGTRHMVFRRTNLPCLVCGTPIKQKRQATHLLTDEEEERTRIVYYCPICQKVE
jgi:endonuclease-8